MLDRGPMQTVGTIVNLPGDSVISDPIVKTLTGRFFHYWYQSPASFLLINNLDQVSGQTNPNEKKNKK